ncbi:MAG: hypothetical protein AAF411_29640 [Myxococcota bacterium]
MSRFLARNTDDATNLNVGTVTDVPLVGNIDTNITDASLFAASGNTGVVVSESGLYKIRAQVHLDTTNTQRANVRLRLSVNGTLIGSAAAGNYIRSASGHVESGDAVEEYLQLNAGDVVRLTAAREAQSGTSRLAQSGTSYLYLEKLA